MRRLLTIAVLLAAVTTVSGEEIDEHWSLALGALSDFEVSISIQQESPDAIPDEYAAKEVHPLIDFRCSARGDGTVTLLVDWRRFISSFNTEVGFKVDDGKADWLKMGVDSSNRITIANSAEDTARLIESLKSGSTLAVEVAPYSEPSVTVHFDVSTFADAYAKLVDSCT